MHPSDFLECQSIRIFSRVGWRTLQVSIDMNPWVLGDVYVAVGGSDDGYSSSACVVMEDRISESRNQTSVDMLSLRVTSVIFYVV